MDFEFKFETKDTKTHARAGIIKTPHGEIKTPAFSPVGTRASVKTLSPEDIKLTHSQVILSNTYHLYLRPGTKVLTEFGGFGPFMGWDGPTITDSGGYQVSFLWDGSKEQIKERNEDDKPRVVKIDDNGATFSSYIDGTKHILTSEISMDIQKILAADIIMAFDHPLGASKKIGSDKEAFARTLNWEERSFRQWEKNKKLSIQNNYQALFGIIQGETDVKLRKESLKFILDMGFPGLAMGGESIGSDPKITAEALDTIVDLLPDDKPLHALGLGGGPEGIFAAVERGVDIFDNTGITRMARTGLLFIYPEDGGNIANKFRIDITKSKFKEGKSPLSKICKCYMCQNFSTAYIHHLFVSKEILGLRLATLHNITFINSLMQDIRNSINNNDFLDFKNSWI